MRKATPVNIIICYPKTEKGRHEIAQRIAAFQASKITAYLEKLNCPSLQKIELIDAVIKGLSQGSEFKRGNAGETGTKQCNCSLWPGITILNSKQYMQINTMTSSTLGEVFIFDMIFRSTRFLHFYQL